MMEKVSWIGASSLVIKVLIRFFVSWVLLSKKVVQKVKVVNMLVNLQCNHYMWS